jgi:hypothetical protein
MGMPEAQEHVVEKCVRPPPTAGRRGRRSQVDQLVAAILTARAAEAELAEQRRSSERSEDTRTVLPGR